MFNKKFKLIVTAIGLVAVLMTVMVMPGATQGNPSVLPNRSQVQQGVSQAFSSLVAATPLLFNTDDTVFTSTPATTMAFVPLHRVEIARLKDKIISTLLGENESVPVGGLIITDPVKIKGKDGNVFNLAPGAYILKVTVQDKVAQLSILNQEGVLMGSISDMRWIIEPSPFDPTPTIEFSQQRTQGQHYVTVTVWYRLAEAQGTEDCPICIAFLVGVIFGLLMS